MITQVHSIVEMIVSVSMVVMNRVERDKGKGCGDGNWDGDGDGLVNREMAIVHDEHRLEDHGPMHGDGHSRL